MDKDTLANYAARFLKNMKTESELRRYLLDKSEDKDLVEEIIEECKSYKYIDDEIYASFYVQDAFKLKYIGSNKIIYELRKKGINENYIENALSKYADLEFKALELIKNKKEKTLKNEKDPYKKKEKLFRFLMQRGFNYSDIKEVI